MQGLSLQEFLIVKAGILLNCFDVSPDNYGYLLIFSADALCHIPVQPVFDIIRTGILRCVIQIGSQQSRIQNKKISMKWNIR